MTETKEQRDERRLSVMLDRGLNANTQDAYAIAASDAAAGIGYYDTSTHVAVPRIPTEAMTAAGDVELFESSFMHDTRKNIAAHTYIAMLAAHEGDQP